MAVKGLDFSEEAIHQWWGEVKDNPLADLKRHTQRVVKNLLEGALEEGMVRYAGRRSMSGQRGGRAIGMATTGGPYSPRLV